MQRSSGGLVWWLPSMLLGCGSIGAEGQMPQAHAGFDQIVGVGDAVDLDGSLSLGEGSLQYRWQLLAKPAGSTAVLSATNLQQTSFVADEVGDYLIALTVRAAGQASLADLVAVSARNQPPVALAACSLESCQVLHGRSAGLVSTSYDPDGEPISHQWTQISEDCAAHCPLLTSCSSTSVPITAMPVLISNATSTNASFTAPQTKDVQVVLQLSVSDSRAQASRCVAYTVYNTPPFALLASFQAGSPPTNPSSPVASGSLFKLRVVTPADPDGDAVSFFWQEQSISEPAHVDTPGSIAAPEAAETLVMAPQVSELTTVVYQITVDDGVDSAVAHFSVEVNP